MRHALCDETLEDSRARERRLIMQGLKRCELVLLPGFGEENVVIIFCD